VGTVSPVESDAMTRTHQPGAGDAPHVSAVIEQSEQFFRLLADKAPVLIWMSDTDGQCIYFNRPWLDFTGRTIDQEFGAGWLEGVHPDDRERCWRTYETAFHARRDFSMEYRLRRADGAYRWILDNGAPFEGLDGSFAGYFGSGIDITDHRELEHRLNQDVTERIRISAELRKSNERYRLASTSARVGVWEWTADSSVISSADHELAEQLGFEGTEGRTGPQWLEVVHPDDRERVLSIWTALVDGRSESVESAYRIVNPDGTVWWQRTHFTVTERAGGHAGHIVGVTTDITELKRIEYALRESESRYRAFFELNAVGAAG
jgi:PAS domain S-box-containing protein